ncbi:hypothetical protein TNCV_2752571 [Trichonephila clavipes]|nr:hypothetical protein TNCV_2752571 [Trichonephila clavipes]
MWSVVRMSVLNRRIQRRIELMTFDRKFISYLIPLHNVGGLRILDYVTFDDGLPTSATEVEETVDLSESMNSDSDAELDNETPIDTVTFSNDFHCLETVKTYLIQQDTDHLIGTSAYASQHPVVMCTGMGPVGPGPYGLLSCFELRTVV